MAGLYCVRCHSCRRVVLRDIPRILDRESDALVSHRKICRPELVAQEEQRWRRQLGGLLEQLEVTYEGS